MPKKLVVIFIVIIMILLSYVIINQYILQTSYTYSQEFSLKTSRGNEVVYNNSDINIIEIYNNLFCPMDEILESLFEDYNNEIKTTQELILNNYKMEVNIEKNTINIPNVYINNNSEIDDSVLVEIEEVDGKKYIPVYLVANIPGVQVYIDNKEVYDTDNYYNGISALNCRKDIHDIEIVVEEESELDIISKEYVGEEQGALWREEALKRVEKYRKSDTNIVVKNQNGQTINNVNVDIQMDNNEFKFGTSIRMITASGTNKYTRINRNFFNTIGSENGFKWSVISENGSTIPNDVINFAKENNMYIRGHLLWGDALVADTKQLLGNINGSEEGTMAYIYKQYNEGNISDEEIEELINDLQIKFESIVLQHIEKMMLDFPDVNEWDVINEPISQQYFKYYLYERNLLTDNNFLTSTRKNRTTYTDNEEYYQFMVKCFDKARETNPNIKLAINDNKINGNISSEEASSTIRIINNISKYTNNIDALGVQYHVKNNYQHTPQSYYNQINYVLEQTELTDAVVTEYDNYVVDKKNKYTDAEKETKANYLRDTLIACYSNQNISGFNFWVYNSGTGSFVQEEWDVYEELMKEWLNDEQSGTTDENGLYSTRAYNGEYTATVEVNGLKAEKTFTVSPDTDTVEIIINNTAEKLNIKQMPIKIKYIQGKEDLDLTGGILEVLYNDGTTKEIPLTDKNIEISSMDNNILGKQTITVKYENLETSFTIEVLEDIIGNVSSEILQNYEEFEQSYSNEIQNTQNAAQEILNLKEKIQILQNNVVIENNEELYQYADTINNISLQLIENNINNENIYSIINDTYKILKLYEQLNTLAVEQNITPDTQDIINRISEFNNKVSYYEDLNISTIKEFIIQAENYIKNIENNSIYAINASYLTNCSNMILNNYINNYLNENQLTLNYNTQEFTNKDVTITLNAGNDQTIKIKNTNSNTYTITENGEYLIEYTRRDFTDSITVNVNWIDKQAPIINGIKNEEVYTEPVQIIVEDENLENITFTKDGQVIEFVNGVTISEDGTYKIIATDKAKNETTVEFIYVDLQIPDYEIKEDKYIINIEPNTTVEEFLTKMNTSSNITLEKDAQQLSNEQKVSTGTELTIENSIKYTLVVTGDITGDGNVNISDLVKLNMYSVGKFNLQNEYLLAGDVNHDRNVNIGDLVRLNLFSIGKINSL